MPRSHGHAEFKANTKHFKGKTTRAFPHTELESSKQILQGYLITRKSETPEEGGL